MNKVTKETYLDFDLLPTLVGCQLRRAQISVFDDFVKTMTSVQISPRQFGVITLIAEIPGLTQSALARAVGIKRSTMVAVIDALEGRRLVKRRPSVIDRRSYALVLSSQGIKMFELLKLMVLKHESRVTAHLSPEERRQLLNLLSQLTHERD